VNDCVRVSSLWVSIVMAWPEGHGLWVFPFGRWPDISSLWCHGLRVVAGGLWLVGPYASTGTVVPRALSVCAGAAAGSWKSLTPAARACSVQRAARQSPVSENLTRARGTAAVCCRASRMGHIYAQAAPA
jgi:hypothetical protein